MVGHDRAGAFGLPLAVAVALRCVGGPLGIGNRDTAVGRCRLVLADEVCGDLGREGDDVALLVLAAQPVMNRANRDDDANRQALTLTSATMPLTRSSEHSNVASHQII